MRPKVILSSNSSVMVAPVSLFSVITPVAFQYASAAVTLGIVTEHSAARLAAERMSDSERERLRSCFELSEFYMAKKNDERCGELDSEFHSIIFKASGSRHLYKILSDLHKNIKAYRRLSLSVPERAEKSIMEHREILEAILSGNADEAERKSSLHIRNALLNFKGLKP